MQHVRVEAIKGRRVTQDEATALRLPGSRPVADLDEWRCILHQAADILDHLGWCRGTLERGRKHCTVGAIVAAYNKGEVSCDIDAVLPQGPALQWIIGKVARRLTQVSDWSEFSVMAWNDLLAHNAKEVIAVLRAAAQD